MQPLSDTNTQKKQLLLNLITFALVGLAVLGGFYRTVFCASPISRVYQLGQRDTLFSKYLQPGHEGYDAAAYQYFVPSHFFLTEQFRKGVVPLWNPLAGCGEPFLADVESACFWPFRLALLFIPPLRSWNLLIVANVFNFAFGTFLLCKALNLRRFATIYASLTCAFCPYLIFQSELIGSSSSLIPYVMAAFTLAHLRRELFVRALAGLACAIMIVSGHPEPPFFGIACASTLFILLAAFVKDSGAALPRRLASSLADIAAIGAFAFCFSAFLLLPFFELLKNTDCYKLGLTGHRDGVPLNSILINLIHPAYGNSSPFLGLLFVPLVFCSLWYGFAGNRFVRALAVCSLLFTAVMCQAGPLDMLMNSKMFSWFVPKYCWPSLLVMLTVLSASGFQYLTAEIQKDWRAAARCVTAGCLFTVLCLAALQAFPWLLNAARQDEAFEQMRIIARYFNRDLILLIGFAVLSGLSKFCGQARPALIVLAVASCTIVTVAPLARQASPPGRTFNYDLVEPIPFIKEHNERIVTMGRHVFCPSSNFCYGIDNLVPVNVYHPLRFQKFLVACGITPEGVNQFFDGRLTPVADLAAVKYVVTPFPVLSSTERLPEPVDLQSNQTISWGAKDEVRLTGAGLCLYPENREIGGSLRFQVRAERARDLGIQAVLFDEKKNVLWLGDIDRLMYEFSKISPEQEHKIMTIKRDITVPLPEHKGPLTLALQMFDWQVGKYLAGSICSGGLPDNVARLARVAQPTSMAQPASLAQTTLSVADCTLLPAKLESRLIVNSSGPSGERYYRLCEETISHIRVYENRHALPHAYLCHAFKSATDASEALKMIQNPTFAPDEEVVLEPAPAGRSEQQMLEAIRKLAASNRCGIQAVSSHREDCNNISFDIEAREPSLLIVSEAFYPGWKAIIEQATRRDEATIMHANYMFQSVLVPPGKCRVTFKFCPAGCISGSVLLVLATFAMVGAGILMYKRRKAA